MSIASLCVVSRLQTDPTAYVFALRAKENRILEYADPEYFFWGF